jgi:hypothetical protein
MSHILFIALSSVFVDQGGEWICNPVSGTFMKRRWWIDTFVMWVTIHLIVTLMSAAELY